MRASVEPGVTPQRTRKRTRKVFCHVLLLFILLLAVSLVRHPPDNTILHAVGLEPLLRTWFERVDSNELQAVFGQRLAERAFKLMDANGDGEQMSTAALESLLDHVETEYKAPCKSILMRQSFSFSQAWQDWYIFHNHFADRQQWGNGVYVDIGTNHPTVISNTLFFDKCLGWRGVCFEPQEQYHGLIKATRNCTLVPSCVVGRGAERSRRRVGAGGSAYFEEGAAGASGSDNCVDATQILPTLLGANTRIDLLSIDIEAMEAEVLRCFPFQAHNIQAILIETATHPMHEVDLFFHRHGYVNAQTFLNQRTRTPSRRYWHWLDNLYIRAYKPTVFPPTAGVHPLGVRLAKKYRGRWAEPWLNLPFRQRPRDAPFGKDQTIKSGFTHPCDSVA